MRVQRLAATWMRELEAVAARIEAFAPHLESRDRLRRFMRVTVAGDTRRHGWQLAEAAAEATPHCMQRLVARAAWDVAGIRDACALPATAWTRRRAMAGSKGARTYDWTLVPLARIGADGQHALRVRRHPVTGDRAVSTVFSPHCVPLSTRVRVAGQRWAIEQAGTAGIKPRPAARMTAAADMTCNGGTRS